MVAGKLEPGFTMTDTTDGASLYARTLYLASNRPARIKQKDIAEACGFRESWLSDFMNQKKTNPNVHDVQKLHDYLVSVSA